MTECAKMKLFIDNNYAMEYILWETQIYPLMTESQDDINLPDLTNTDIDIVD